MNTGKSRKLLKRIILICIITLFAGVIFLGVFHGVNSFIDKEEVNQAAVVDAAVSFDSGDGKSANTAYVINNAQQLKYFANEVNKGRHFRGEYIKLGADISFIQGGGVAASKGQFAGIGSGYVGSDGASWGYQYVCFAGNFDGAGHKVSDFHINSGVFTNWDLSSTADDTLRLGGFFGVVAPTAKIENLWLDNFVIYNNTINASTDLRNLCFGGLVAQICDLTWGQTLLKAGNPSSTEAIPNNSKAKINECNITNLEFYGISQKHYSVFAGGIIGCADYAVEINNCKVENFKNSLDCVLTNNDNNCYYGKFIGFYYYENYTLSINNSLAAGSFTSSVSSFKKFIGNSNNPGVNSYATLRNVYDSTEKSWSFDSMNSIGGKDENTIWYIATGYKSGVPFLRQFLSWSNCYITSDKTAYVGSYKGVLGSNEYIIEFPSDLDDPVDLSSETKLEIFLLGQKVYVTNNADYVCEHAIATWTTISTYKYSVTLKGDARDLTFYDVDNATLSAPSNNPKAYYQCGTTISISGEKYGREHAYKSITIYYTDAVTGQIKSCSYTAKEGYYINLKNIGSFFTRTSSTVGSDEKEVKGLTVKIHSHYSFSPLVEKMGFNLDMQ